MKGCPFAFFAHCTGFYFDDLKIPDFHGGIFPSGIEGVLLGRSLVILGILMLMVLRKGRQGVLVAVVFLRDDKFICGFSFSMVSISY